MYDLFTSDILHTIYLLALNIREEHISNYLSYYDLRYSSGSPYEIQNPSRLYKFPIIHASNTQLEEIYQNLSTLGLYIHISNKYPFSKFMVCL